MEAGVQCTVLEWGRCGEEDCNGMERAKDSSISDGAMD
jgi:hypothetical protein